MNQIELTPQILIEGYRNGAFPMAIPEMGNDIYWFRPDPRGILPLESFHISKSLARTIKKQPFQMLINRNFSAVIEACSCPRADSDDTWISQDIKDVYTELHHLGYAHSIECYKDDELVGGLYGVALGAVFFGESMFHIKTDASKVALYYLVKHLRQLKFKLLDIQWVTSHLKTFGAIEIPRFRYEQLLVNALKSQPEWSTEFLFEEKG